MHKKKEWTERICSMLPERPDLRLEAWVKRFAKNNMGGEFILFSRESVCREKPEIKQIMEKKDWEAYDAAAEKRAWGARCTCTDCKEDFLAGWTSSPKRGEKGIVLTMGEDGIIYDGWTDKLAENAVEFGEGETFQCPCCGAETKLLHISRLRRGKTYACQVASVEEVGDVAVLMYWLVRRQFDEWGGSEVRIRPREAVAIDPNGRLQRFSHTKYSDVGERPSESWRHQVFNDPELIAYYTAEDGVGGRHRVGAVYYDGPLPDLGGTTGEKTGLIEYIQAGGVYAVKYLKIWEKHRNIENLVKFGKHWAMLIGDSIEGKVNLKLAYNERPLAVELGWINYGRVKPHEMLGMSKEEFRQVTGWSWTRGNIETWREYKDEVCDRVSAEQFNDWFQRYGGDNVRWLVKMFTEGPWDAGLADVMKYLDKQQDIDILRRAEMYIDYRDMLSHIIEGDPTEDQLWPKRLLAAHDRMAGALKVNSKEHTKEFKAAAELYAPLEWTDGDLCIVVPKSNADLIREGKVLHHCVGGYGETHISGAPIFFVRHYRRPERSYYTLNIDMRAIPPKERQLHGYRNEHHYKGTAYMTHKIPQKVRDFVDRWEREVLQPWAQARYKEALEAEKSVSKVGNKKKGRTAA